MILEKSQRRIAILGNYGRRNLGDEATLASLVQHIRERAPDAELLAISTDPADTVARHDILAAPASRDVALRARSSRPSPSVEPRQESALKQRLRRHAVLFAIVRTLARLVRAAKGAVRDPLFKLGWFRRFRRTDVLVIGGGGQLCDQFGGATGYPLELLRWVALARLAGTRVVMLNVGAGPLRTWLSRRLVRATLSLADYCCLRDEASRALVESIGAKGDLKVYPDLAFALDLEASVSPTPAEAGSVALNVFPHFDGRYLPSDAARYDSYLERMASFALWLLRNGHDVTLFPTQLQADPHALDDLKALLLQAPDWQALRQRLSEPSVETVEDVARVLTSNELVVATRFHAIVLALALGRPVLALANHSKMKQAMIDTGQARYVIDIDGSTLDDLVLVFRALEADRANVAAELDARRRTRARLVDEEFDELFGAPRPSSLAAAT